MTATNGEFLTTKVQRAINLAGSAHGFQQRKANRAIPYMVHPMSVGLLLAGHGYNEEAIIAGILHDTVEDTDLTLRDIRHEFGAAVAGWVKEVSETKDQPLTWEERKRQGISHVKTMSPTALAIKTADAISNMTDMLVGDMDQGEDFWHNFSQGKYAQIARYAALTEALLERQIECRLTRDVCLQQAGLFVELEMTFRGLLTCF